MNKHAANGIIINYDTYSAKRLTVMGRTTIAIPLAHPLDNASMKSIETLAHDLGALGINVTLSNPLTGGVLEFCYDTDAQKRGAGRKKKTPPSESATRTMDQKQLDEWLLKSPVKEVMEELNIGRATAFRRRAEARKRIEYALVSLEQDDNAD